MINKQHLEKMKVYILLQAVLSKVLNTVGGGCCHLGIFKFFIHLDFNEVKQTLLDITTIVLSMQLLPGHSYKVKIEVCTSS